MKSPEFVSNIGGRKAMSDTCAFRKCRADTDLTYLGKPICGRHWGQWCERTDELRKRLGLPPKKSEASRKPYRFKFRGIEGSLLLTPHGWVLEAIELEILGCGLSVAIAGDDDGRREAMHEAAKIFEEEFEQRQAVEAEDKGPDPSCSDGDETGASSGRDRPQVTRSTSLRQVSS